MKNTISTVLLGLALVFTGTSCSSDDDGGNSGNAAAGTIQAKVDGSTVTTLEMVTFAHRITQGGNTTITMQGNTGGTSSKAFNLNVNSFDGEGTYNIGGGANLNVTASYIETTIDVSNPGSPEINTWSAPFDSSVAGEIKFSQVTDTKVMGTFKFTGTNQDDNSTKQITEGSFNINITDL